MKAALPSNPFTYESEEEYRIPYNTEFAQKIN